MPTIPQSELPKPKSWDEFEDIVWDLYARAWNDRHAQRYGRSGQAQQGVDIYGQPPHLGGGYAGVQCKRYEPGELTQPVIEAEISKAESFVPPLGEYTIATTHPRDATMQQIIRDINDECAKKGQFPVHVLFWEDICSRLSHPDNRDLLQKHYGDWLSADFVTRPALAAEECRELEHAYLKRVADECRYLYTEGVDRVRAKLTDVFVMLEAVESPHPEEWTDVAPVPERAGEMGLSERVAGRRKHRDKAKPDQDKPSSPPSPPVPLSKAMAEHRHLVILGEPGTGKSTTLQFVTLCYAQAGQGWTKQRLDLDEDRVPVQIELRQYDGQERLDRFLVHWLDGQFYVPEVLAQEWLDEGRLAILLDGLDEVPQERRSDVVRAIEGFAASAEGKACRIVVSSRIAGYQRTRVLDGDFGHYTICPFADPEDALPYTAGWLQLLRGTTDEEAKAEAQDLLEQMEEQVGLRRVRSNPLLLRLIVTVYIKTGELARNRAEVYRRYVDEVIWRRAEVREQPRWSLETIDAAVEAIAWMLQIHSGQTKADLANVAAGAVEGLTDTQCLIDYLQERLGLLAAYGYEQGDLIAFRHLTLREYFVARRLARAWAHTDYRESTWEFLHPRLHYPAWREPILLMAGMLKEGQATTLVERTLKARSPYERELHRDLLLVAATMGDGASIAPSTAERVIGTMLRLLWDQRTKWWHRWILPVVIWAFIGEGIYRYAPMPGLSMLLGGAFFGGILLLSVGLGLLPYVQCILTLPERLSGRGAFASLQPRLAAALGELIRLEQASIIKRVMQALQHKDSSVRQAAVEVLGMSGDARTLAPLVRALSDEESEVRQSAAKALKTIAGTRAVEALVQALKEDQSPGLQKEAMWVLAVLGDARAREPLIQALRDQDSKVRGAAVEGLRRLGGASVVDPLIQALADRDTIVRQTAAAALETLGDTRAVEPLAQALKDEDASVRQAAAEALGKLGDTRALEPLVQALKDENAGVRQAAAEVLGRLRDTRAVEPLVQALGDADSSVRRTTAKSLGRLGDTRAAEPLAQALADQDNDVRSAAVDALGMLGDDRALRFLVQALGHEDSGVRQAAAQAMWMFNDARARESLTQALADAEASVRRAAIWSLGMLRDAHAVEPVVKALEDKDQGVREAAAKTLGMCGDARALAPLIQALRDDESNVRQAAAEALGTLDDARVVQPLIQALRDEESGVHSAVVRALSNMGETAIGPLVRALADEHTGVRRGAAWVLGKGGDARAVKPLIQALDDRDRDVRRAAAEALGKQRGVRAVAPLVRALKDRYWQVRSTAVWALIAVDPEGAAKPLIHALGDRDWQVRRAASMALRTVAESRRRENDEAWQRSFNRALRLAAHRLWQRLTDMPDPMRFASLVNPPSVADAAYEALERSVARFAELEVEALGDNPPLFAATPSRPRLSPASLAALGILIAALSGLASNVLAAYLQEQYALLTDAARIVIVAAVFLFTLAGSIWIAWRLEKRVAWPTEMSSKGF